MGGGMMGGRGPAGTEAGRDLFAINGQPFDMQRLNFSVSRDAVERWIVTPTMMMHPFHIHGVAFQVLSEGGRLPRPENRGWKDTVLVRDRVELAARFNQPASREMPFMFHCHILEHEDRGMMGQFTVG
jgi:FtsP/CotA-like multicopper oxidase with cupredoxin domain